MPQTDAAKKALRVSARKKAANDRWRRKAKQALLAVRDAIHEKNKQAAEAAYGAAQKLLDRAARRHVIHPNKAARKKARIKQAIAKL